MNTHIVRRLYCYAAAFVGLQMLVAGFRALCVQLLERWIGAPTIAPPAVAAMALAGSVALVAVGIPLWAIHWAMARRDARESEGQRSALRRLYAYAVLLVAALGGMLSLQQGLAFALAGAGGGSSAPGLAGPLVGAAVSAAVWAAHWRIFAADRDAVERTPPNATLRRWYLALTLWASLAMLSFGAGVLIHGLLQRFAFGAPGSPQQLTEPAAALVAGLAVWLPHERWSRHLARRPGPLQADELGSTLRQVYLALVVVAALVAALTGLTALIAAGLLAALAGAPWADAFAGETRSAAAVATALPLLLYHREQLIVTARLSGSAERAGSTRRILGYLLGAVSLAALYFGLGGLGGALLRQWLGASVVGEAWRTSVSWYAATAIVALPAYALATWRSEALARGSPDEELALSRRIYLYAALLFGVVATVVATTGLVRLTVMALLGAGGAGAAGEIARLAGYACLGAVVVAAYAALLRRAAAARGDAGAGRAILLLAGEPLAASLTAALAHELPGAAVATFGQGDSPDRRAALAGADLLILTPGDLADPALAAFGGPRLLIATPPAGVTLVGARRESLALAREAARVARRLCLAVPAEPAPPARAAPAPRPA